MLKNILTFRKKNKSEVIVYWTRGGNFVRIDLQYRSDF